MNLKKERLVIESQKEGRSNGGDRSLPTTDILLNRGGKKKERGCVKERTRKLIEK